MRKEFVYSFLALGAIPVTVNAAVENVKATDVDLSVTAQDGSEAIKKEVGMLMPGNYKLTGKLTSRLYKVTIKIGGAEVEFDPDPDNEVDVDIDFTIDKATNVTMEAVSESTASGSKFTLGQMLLDLSFDFDAAKAQLVAKTNGIEGFDQTSLNATLDAIKATYASYVENELYNLDNGAAVKKVSNAVADYFQTLCNDRHQYHLATVSAMEAELVDASAYLLDAAKAELEALDDEITAAIKANGLSKANGTAIDDYATNLAILPTEAAFDEITAKYNNQSKANKQAYEALKNTVDNLQKKVDAKVEDGADLSASKAEAQKAVDALKALMDAAYNSEAQLDLATKEEWTKAEETANEKVGDYADDVTNYNAYKKGNDKIAKTQTNYDKAKTEAAKKVSKDKKYAADGDNYTSYLEAIQKSIDDLKKALKDAYDNGDAAGFSLNQLATIEGQFNNYVTQSGKAVDNYDVVVAAIADYQKDLDAAIASFKDSPVLAEENGDYQLKLDAIQKKINDLQAAVDAALANKTCPAHWNAMQAVQKDDAIKDEIKALVAEKNSAENTYSAGLVTTDVEALQGRIDKFNADYKPETDEKLGSEAPKYKAQEDDIQASLTAAKTSLEAFDSFSETIDYTAKVSQDQKDWGNTGSAWNHGVQVAEKYGDSSKGVKLSQEVSVENGIYDVEVLATSHNARGEGGATLDGTAEDVAHVFAKSGDVEVTTPITARGVAPGFVDGEETPYLIKGVKVENGKLTIGLAVDKENMTGWHTIQIKSLKASTASVVAGLGDAVKDLAAKQTVLENTAKALADGIAANTTLKESIVGEKGTATTLDAAITKFNTDYGINPENKGILGNSFDEISKEETDIKAKLDEAKGKVNDINPKDLPDADVTATVDKSINGWVLDQIPHWGNGSRTTTVEGVTLAEQWTGADADPANADGRVIYQKMTDMPNGIYAVELYANAVDQANGNPNKDKTDIAFVYANGIQTPVKVTTTATLNVYKLENVQVADGVLEMGIAKAKGGTNWHSIQIKSLTQLASTANDNKNLTDQKNAIAELTTQQAALETKAKAVKENVAKNNQAKTDADAAMAALGTYLLDNLKNLADVSDEYGNYSTSKAKKSDPKDWAVFRSGLDEDKTYPAKKAAIDGDITALSDAITVAFGNETLGTDWNDGLTVVGKDGQGNETSTTYSIAEIKNAIDNLKKEAKAESDNYWAYRNVNKNNMKKLLPDTAVVSADRFGADALAYYQGLKDQYIADKADILTRMQASLNARTAVADRKGYESEISDLIKKVKAIYTDGTANLKQFNEETALLQETQDLWYEVYAEIAATDESTKRDEYLTNLDKIQAKIDLAKETIEKNVKEGKSVANEQKTNLTGIKGEIKELQNAQKEGYNAQIAQDSKDRFDAINKTIAEARKAYKQATATMTEYNEAESQLLQNAIEAVKEQTEVLVDVLYNFPDESSTLTGDVAAAYEEWGNREDLSLLFDKEGELQAAAEALKNKVAQAEEDFIDAIRDAVNADCAQKVADFSDMRDEAANKVVEYNDYAGGQALTDDDLNTLFKDVDNMIATIKDAMGAPELAELDRALTAAENAGTGIEAKLAQILNDKAYAALNTVLGKIEAVKGQLTEDEAAQVDEFRAILNEANANQAVADNYADLTAELNALKALAGDATGVVEAYDAFQLAATDLQTKLDAAMALANKFLAGATINSDSQFRRMAYMMLGTIQRILNNAKSEVEEFYTDETLSYGEKTDLFNDQKWTVDDLSLEINETLGTPLFDTELEALESYVNELEQQYVLYANDFETEGVQEKAKAYKAQIEAVKAKLGAFKAVKDADKQVVLENGEIADVPAETLKVAVEIGEEQVELTLLDLEQEIAELVTKLSEENNPAANNTALQKLQNAANALNSEIGTGYEVDNFTAEEQADIAAQKAAIDKAIEAVKAQIEDKKDNILPYAETIEEQIDKIKAQMGELKATAEQAQQSLEQKRADVAQLKADADEGLAALQTAIDEAKATINAFTYTTADDYQSKFELLQKNADDKKAAIEAKEADGSLSYDDVDGIFDLSMENDAIIADVLNTAANREMLGKLADMEAQYEGINLNENDFTINDWKAIGDKKQAIVDALAALDGDISTAKNFNESYDQLTNGPLKDQIAEAQALIDELKQFAADNQLTPDDVVPGDIDGDGEITGDDVDQFVEDYMAGNMPTDPEDPNFARFDANKDGIITIADAVAIFNLSNGLNFDGSDPDFVAARGDMAAELTGTLTTQTEVRDGLTRISFILESNFDYSAFSVDVMTSADVKVVGENAMGVSLRSNDLNGVHRIAGLCLGSSVSGNGAVLTLDLEGNGSVQFSNIVFATASGKSISFDLSGATGIGAVAAEKQGTVYSLSGRIVNGMKKGVNIVRDAYGNAKKKLVK